MRSIYVAFSRLLCGFFSRAVQRRDTLEVFASSPILRLQRLVSKFKVFQSFAYFTFDTPFSDVDTISSVKERDGRCVVQLHPLIMRFLVRFLVQNTATSFAKFTTMYYYAQGVDRLCSMDFAGACARVLLVRPPNLGCRNYSRYISIARFLFIINVFIGWYQIRCNACQRSNVMVMLGKYSLPDFVLFF